MGRRCIIYLEKNLNSSGENFMLSIHIIIAMLLTFNSCFPSHHLTHKCANTSQRAWLTSPHGWQLTALNSIPARLHYNCTTALQVLAIILPHTGTLWPSWLKIQEALVWFWMTSYRFQLILHSLHWLPVSARIRFKTRLQSQEWTSPFVPYGKSQSALWALWASSTAQLDPPSLKIHERQASRLFSILTLLVWTLGWDC